MQNDPIKIMVYGSADWRGKMRRGARRTGLSMSQYIIECTERRIVQMDRQAAACVLYAVREMRDALIAGTELLRRCQCPPEEALQKMHAAVAGIEATMEDLRSGRIGVTRRVRGRRAAAKRKKGQKK